MNARPAPSLSDPAWPWREAGLAVRQRAGTAAGCALSRPGDELGRRLAGADWRIAVQSATLLLHVAADRALLLHWRSLCAEPIHRQLRQHGRAQVRAYELRGLRAWFVRLQPDPTSHPDAEPDFS